MSSDQVPLASASVSTTATTATSAEPADRAAAFRAVTGNAESVSGGHLLIAAYAFVWIVVLIVVARVFQRQTAVADRLDALEADVRRGKAKAK